MKPFEHIDEAQQEINKTRDEYYRKYGPRALRSKKWKGIREEIYNRWKNQSKDQE